MTNEERAAKCPTCESDDPKTRKGKGLVSWPSPIPDGWKLAHSSMIVCDNPWHGEAGAEMTQTDERIRQEFEKWAREQPHCTGYPGCDGDLTATDHEADCPMSKVEDSDGRGSAITPLSAYRAGRDAGLEEAATIAFDAATNWDARDAIRALIGKTAGERQGQK